MPAIKTMQDLLVHGLRDIYYAERKITKALPKMVKNAEAPELKQALTAHLEETKGQIGRLDEVFEQLGVAARGVRCEAIEGLVEEAEETMEEVAEPSVRDAAIIVSAQKVEHYEMAAYGSLAAMAIRLGHQDVATLLQATLAEEKAADEKLSQVAAGASPAKKAK